MLLRDHHAEAVEIPAEKKELYLPPVEVNFTPQVWNNIANAIGPWAYALDIPQIGKAKPGFLSHETWVDDFTDTFPQTKDELAIALRKDGLLYYEDFLPPEGHVIAYFTKPGKRKKSDEVLIARRDSNGLWSYTAEGGGCGDYYPQQEDLRGAPVTDIRTAYFCGYDDFLGFASIPYEGLSFYPRVILPFDEPETQFLRDIPAIHRHRFDF